MMQIIKIDAPNSKIGMKEISETYGDNVLILSNSRVAGKSQIVIAADENSRPAAPLQAPRIAPIESAPSPEAVFASTQSFLQGLSGSGESQLIKDLTALIKTEFEGVQKHLLEIKHSAQTRPDNELSALLDDSAIPASLMRKLLQETAGCQSAAQITDSLEQFLEANLPANARLTGRPEVHVLAGNHGSGKTLCAVRLAARINAECQHPAIVVSYKAYKDGAWAQLQLLGAKTGVDVYRANDIGTLVTIANENIDHSSVIIELPSSNSMDEALLLNQELPFARFHMVVPCDSYGTALSRMLKTSQLRFSSVLITRLDCHVYWPLISFLLEQKLPLLFGCASPDIAQPLIDIDKSILTDAVLLELRQRLSEWTIAPVRPASASFGSAGINRT